MRPEAERLASQLGSQLGSRLASPLASVRRVAILDAARERDALESARLLRAHLDREDDEKCVVLAVRALVELDARVFASGSDAVRAEGGAWRARLRGLSADMSRSARVRHAALLAHDELEARARPRPVVVEAVEEE